MAAAYSKSRISKIVRRFGLIPSRSDSIASIYRKNAIFRVQTKSGTYALKPFFRNRQLRSDTMDQMKIAAGYAHLLMNNGFNSMPKWLASSSGRLWTLDHGRPFYVTAWIHGRSMENQEDFEKLGQALATLHTTPNNLTSPIHGPFYDHIRLWQHRDRLFRRRMAGASHTSSWIRKWYKEFGESCNRISDWAWAELKSPETVTLLEQEKRRPALIHSDVTAPNVIIADDGQLFMIDWDRVKLGSAYVELATALMNTTRFNPAFIHALLKGYEGIRPLDRSERKLVSCLYQLPREAWFAARFPKSMRSRNMLAMTKQTWPLRLKAMDVLGEWENRQVPH